MFANVSCKNALSCNLHIVVQRFNIQVLKFPFKGNVNLSLVYRVSIKDITFSKSLLFDDLVLYMFLTAIIDNQYRALHLLEISLLKIDCLHNLYQPLLQLQF